MSIYSQRIALLGTLRLNTGVTPADGPSHPALPSLGEYFRRVAIFRPAVLWALPMSTDLILARAGGAISTDDLANIETDAAAAFRELEARSGSLPGLTWSLVRHILLWSLMVDRKLLAVDEDPSVPLLRIFEGGYALGQEHGPSVSICGELPLMVPLLHVLRREGLAQEDRGCK